MLVVLGADREIRHTRPARELRRIAEARGTRVLWAWCSEDVNGSLVVSGWFTEGPRTSTFGEVRVVLEVA